MLLFRQLGQPHRQNGSLVEIWLGLALLGLSLVNLSPLDVCSDFGFLGPHACLEADALLLRFLRRLVNGLGENLIAWLVDGDFWHSIY